MATTFITTVIVIVIGILVATIVMLAFDLNKKDKEIETIQERQSSYQTQIKNQTEFNSQIGRKIDDLNERVTPIEDNISGIRADAQRTIIAECAKFGMHPTDYVAKHAKKETAKETSEEHTVPSFAKADPDKEYIAGQNEENAKQYEAMMDGRKSNG